MWLTLFSEIISFLKDWVGDRGSGEIKLETSSSDGHHSDQNLTWQSLSRGDNLYCRVITRYSFSSLIPYFHPKCWSLISKTMRILIPEPVFNVHLLWFQVPGLWSLTPAHFRPFIPDPIYLVTTFLSLKCQEKSICPFPVECAIFIWKTNTTRFEASGFSLTHLS